MTTNYQIVEGKETGELAVQIIDPPYDGVIVKVGKVAIHEDKNGEGAAIAFDYDIIKGNVDGDDDFAEVIGDIIVDIIEKKIDTEYGDGNNGEDNSSQPDSE